MKIPNEVSESERIVIGSMLFDPSIIPSVLGMIPSADRFDSGNNATLFRVIVGLYNRHKTVDRHLLLQALKDEDVLDQVGGERGVVELAETTFTAANWDVHAPLVVDAWRERSARQSAERIAHQLKGQGYSSPEAMAAEFEAVAANIRATLPRESVADQKPALAAAFPIEALPTRIARFVEQTAASFGEGVDPVMLAAPALVVAAGAIGLSHVLEINAAYHEPAGLWIGLVLPPSSLKTPALNMATEPLRRIDHRLATKYAEAFERFKMDEAVAKSAHAAWIKGGAKGERPAMPTAPVEGAAYVTGATIEGLVRVLSMNPRGVVWHYDELAGLFNSMGEHKAGKSSDADQLTQLWSATPIKIVRASKPSLVIPRTMVSIIGGIQPRRIAKVLGGGFVDSGMASRFLFVRPTAAYPALAKGAVDRDVLVGYADLIEQLHAYQPDIDADGEIVSNVVKLLGPARQRFEAWYNAHQLRTACADEDARAWFGKIKGYAGRLILVHHVCEVASGLAVDAGEVGEASVIAGLRLADYFAAEMDRIAADCVPARHAAGAFSTEEVVAIIRKLGAERRSATMRDFKNLASYKADPQKFNASMEALCVRGVIRRVEDAKSGPGRPSAAFIMPPDEVDA